MTSAARFVGVLAIGILFLSAVIGSIWLAEADALMTMPTPVVGWALPTPTLFPTVLALEPVVSRPTPTPVPATLETPALTDEVPTTPPVKVCEVREGWVHYVVKPGDTFHNLAERSGTNLQDLLGGNCKQSAYPLQVGEALYMPAAILTAAVPTPFVCQPPSGWQTAIVSPGDTFWSLARAYGLPPSLLLDKNCRTEMDTTLYVGATIYVPYRLVAPTPVPPPTQSLWPTPVPTLPSLPTATASPVPTATPLPTPTSTPTPTPIPSPTPTPTETPVFVPTWTPIPWPLPTAVPPATPRPTHTPTPEVTPTATGEATPTLVATIPATESPTSTSQPTPTAVVEATPTLVASPEPSVEPSVEPSPEPSLEPAFTPTPDLASIATATPAPPATAATVYPEATPTTAP